MKTYKQDLEKALDELIEDFEEIGIPVSKEYEQMYSMYLAIVRLPEYEDKEREQKYMSFMAENYFSKLYEVKK